MAGIVSLRERLLSGGLWSLVGRGATALTALTVNALLARLLPPDEMGAYFIVLSIVSVASILAQLGLNFSIVRLVAESIGKNEQGRAHDAICLVLRCGGMGALFFAGIFAIGAGGWIALDIFHSSMIDGIIGLVAILIIAVTYQQLIAEIFRGLHDIRYSAIFGGLLGNTISLVVFAIFFTIQAHIDIFNVFLFSFLASATSSLIAGTVVWGRLKTIKGKGSLTTGELAAITWPNWISQVMLVIVCQADIWIVGFFQSQEDVAIYGASVKVAQATMLVTGLLYAFVPPIIADMYAKNKMDVLERVLRGSAMANAIIVFPVAIVFLTYSDLVLNLIYGGYYAKGGQVLFFLTVGLMINVLTGLRGSVLIMSGYERDMMKISIFGGSLNIILCVVGAKYWGINGVAVAAMTSMATQSLIELMVVKIRLDIWTYVSMHEFITQVNKFFALRQSK